VTNIGCVGEGLASALAATASTCNRGDSYQPLPAVVAATFGAAAIDRHGFWLSLAINTLFWENKLPVLLFDKFTDNEYLK
jgi:hypothetical protein